MQKFILILILSLSLSNCYTIIKNEKREFSDIVEIENNQYHFPLRITKFNIVCIDTNYIITGSSYRSIPPHVIKRIKDFDFEIYLTVRVGIENTYWDEPFYLKIDRIGGEEDTLIFNEYAETIYSWEQIEFPFKIVAANSERIIFRLGLKDPLQEKIVFVNSNDPFRVVDTFF